jgi:O-antigen/teichoic acid export membrane protein
MIAVVQVLQSFLLYMRSSLSGLQHFNADSIFSVLDRSLMILVCGAVLWTSWFGQKLNMFQFVYAQIAVSFIALAGAGWLVFREVKFFRPQIQLSSFLDVLRSSWPFALLGLLMTLYSRIDTIMLERIHPDGAHEAGIYASAYRLLEAANMIAFLFAGILMPLLSNMFARKENVMPTANLFFRLLMVPSLLLVLGCSVYKEPVMHLLYSEANSYSAQVFSYLIPSFLAWGTVYIYGSLLTAHGSLRFLNISSAIGLAINIMLNFWLIPRYGAKGAAATALITQGIVALSQYVRAHLLFPFSVPPADTLRWAAFVLVSVCSFLIFYDAFTDWKMGFILLTVSNLIFAVAIGLLKLRYFIQLLKFNA